MAGNGDGTLYTVWSSGSLVRYTVTPTRIGGTSVLATSGWSGVRSLSSAGPNLVGTRQVDAFLALTDKGAINEYLFASDGWKRGAELKSSGWGSMSTVVVGGCDEEAIDSRPLYGVTKDANVYAYLDKNGYDLGGGDISGAGLVASRLRGLVFSF